MLTLLLIWIAVGVALALLSRRSGAGLPLAYFLGLSLIHVPGAIIYLDVEEWNRTRLGFEQTVIGTVAFLIAVIIVRIMMFLRRADRNAGVGRTYLTPGSAAALNRLALLYCLLGGVAYFVLMPLSGYMPSTTAIISSFGSLIVVGACLRLWVGQEGRNWLKVWSTIALLTLLPLFTLVQTGFIGFGTYWALGILSFFFAQTTRRLLLLCLAPVVFFVGLSVFVNYMASRNDIRHVVWNDGASLGDRLDRVGDVFANFEWLDLSNSRHRKAIDNRLNQNFLIGVAVKRLKFGQQQYASGETISNMIVSLIPRVLWPDKPEIGGGGNVVTEFTGIRFARGTSVGAGQVFEFYVNFGTWGVIGGFLLFGLLLGYMDLLIIEYLRKGDQGRFLLWFILGVSLLQPGGNLVEIVVSAAGAAAGAYSLNYCLNRRRPTGSIAVLAHNI
jgi:hypothetical protein